MMLSMLANRELFEETLYKVLILLLMDDALDDYDDCNEYNNRIGCLNPSFNG